MQTKQYKYTINGNKYNVVVGETVGNTVTVTVNDEDYDVLIETEKKIEKPQIAVTPTPISTQQNPVLSPQTNKISATEEDAIKAPLPGTIREIKVSVGDEVKEGDTVVVLEAMKMANNLDAERSGKVSAVCVKEGQSVMEGDTLVVIA